MFRPLRSQALAVMTASLVCASAAHADTTYDESIDGDFSGSAGAPTAIVFNTGTNTVIGSAFAGSDTRDFFTFTIPAGNELTALRQVDYSDGAGGGANVGYHALDAGPTSVNPGFGTANDFIGGGHIAQLPSGFDMLPGLGAAVGNGTGFDVPLGPGTYTYIIQQTSPDTTEYHLEFEFGENAWTDLGNSLDGAAGAPLLEGDGVLDMGVTNNVNLSNAAPSATAGLFLSLASTPIPFKGGTLVPFPWFGDILFLTTSPTGTIPLPFALSVTLPPGTQLFAQWAIQDAGAVNGVALSNAIVGEV